MQRKIAHLKRAAERMARDLEAAASAGHDLSAALVPGEKAYWAKWIPPPPAAAEGEEEDGYDGDGEEGDGEMPRFTF